eukprot:gnl/TRDRNA2_/TRDRNA2_78033_c0_seq1.p1 gnl/TRDRNA2_/TRDRNA2_78033_c0~~gnl/TRDRNA2_/TRDRNA2_78033_c0_seq1.p1  ORF type:complete len:579 (-),score=138.09 gnl/TRDRNA2_/TRDRNA2_78033_c0_seq1:92-1828(-)
MSVYTLDVLLDEIALQRSSVMRKVSEDATFFHKVWDAFNRYLTAVMEKRQTLSVPNFCKIGWKVEQHGGKARFRPHFQLQTSFIKAHGVDPRACPIIRDNDLTTIEEFNFSKAAIRFSQELTKDQVWMGLRAIIMKIGLVMSSCQPLNIAFEVGKLMCIDREPKFAFAADYYISQGLDVPREAVVAGDYKPSSATFGPPSKDALSLNVVGSNPQSSSLVKAIDLGGWEDRTGEEPPPEKKEMEVVADKLAEFTETGANPVASSAPDANLESALPLSAVELAQHEALYRHILQLEVEAAAANAERTQWEDHLQKCIQQEQKALDWKKAILKDHSDHLKVQMQQQEEKQRRGRELAVEQASEHSFPCFKSHEVAKSELPLQLRERQNQLKAALDQQVEYKKEKKAQKKIADRAVEEEYIQAGKAGAAEMKDKMAVKKETQKAALIQAWETDVRLRMVRHAIENHSKAQPVTETPSVVPPPGGEALVRDVQAAESGEQLRAEKKGKSAHVGNIPSLPLSQGLVDIASTPMSSARLNTGSSRRTPIGAAGSLALMKAKEANAKLKRPATVTSSPASVMSPRY